MVNQGVGGQEAPIELERFDIDVIAEKPDLVIWQVGTNAVWQRPDQIPPPPSFNKTSRAIRDGLVKLRDETQADVILMDLQYVPAMLTPAKKDKAIEMVEAISELARDAGVNVFRRFAFMKGLYQVEQVSFDRMVDPMDHDRLHDSDWATERVAWAVKLAIVGGVTRHGHQRSNRRHRPALDAKSEILHQRAGANRISATDRSRPKLNLAADIRSTLDRDGNSSHRVSAASGQQPSFRQACVALYNCGMTAVAR
jgi:hypothetical protein